MPPDRPGARPLEVLWTTLLAGLAVVPAAHGALALVVSGARAVGGDAAVEVLTRPGGQPLTLCIAQVAVLGVALVAARLWPEPVALPVRLGLSRGPLTGGSVVLLGTGLAAALDLAVGAVFGVRDATGAPLAVAEPVFGVVAVLVTAVVPALTEEVLFRGWVQRRLATVVPAWLAVVASTVLFALAHTGGSVPHRLATGLVFGVLAWRTGTIWAGAVAHAALNGFMTLYLLFPGVYDALQPVLLVAELVLAVAAAATWLRAPWPPSVPRLSWGGAGSGGGGGVRLQPSSRWLAGPLTGALLVASFPTGWTGAEGLPLAGWLAPVPLLWVLRGGGPAAAFAHGTAAGLVFGVGAHLWLEEALVGFFGLPAAAGVAAVLVHGAWLAPTWGLSAWLTRLALDLRVPLFVAFPVSLMGVEATYPRIFPSGLGSSQVGWPVVLQLAELGGVGLVSAVMGLAAAALVTAAHHLRGLGVRKRPAVVGVVLAGVVLVGTVVYGALRMQAVDAAMAVAPRVSVGIVQPGAALVRATPAEQARTEAWMWARSAEQVAAGAELLVWPEAAVRRTVPRDDPRESEAVLAPAALGAPVLLGSTSADDAGGTFNTAWALSGEGSVTARYDKVHRFPFGEYDPVAELRARLAGRPRTVGLSTGRTLGRVAVSLPSGDPLRLSVMICYEAILPMFVNAGVAESAEAPDLLVVMANDAWFGDTSERALHMLLTVPRTIEQRRSMVRAATSGISALVDPAGRVVASTETAGPDTLQVEVPLLEERTAYARWGDLPARLAFALAVLLAMVRIARGPGGRVPEGECSVSAPGPVH